MLGSLCHCKSGQKRNREQTEETEYVFPNPLLSDITNIHREIIREDMISQSDSDSAEDLPADQPPTKKIRLSSSLVPGKRDRKVPDVDEFDGTSTKLDIFLNALDVWFRMKPTSYPIGEDVPRIYYVSTRMTGSAKQWWIVNQVKVVGGRGVEKWENFEDFVKDLKKSFDNPHKQDDARQQMEDAVWKKDTTQFVTYMRAIQIEACFDASRLWQIMWDATPLKIRELLDRTRMYIARSGPKVVDFHFTELLDTRRK